MLLEYFIEDAQAESTGCLYSLVPDADGMWFTRQQMFGESGFSWQLELYMIAIIIQIIRLCAGPKWLPPEIMISSTDKKQPLPGEWEKIKFTWGNKLTEIGIPGQVLALPPLNRPGPERKASWNETDRTTTSSLQFADLVKSQVLTNSTGLESAANQTGLSPTTLKRKLASMKTSYSEILDQVRLEIARSRLVDPALPIHVIATELGYRYPANFTRAFKRLHGLSPLNYRNKLRL
ncbi:MAG: helix-turn-helix transcriptional regulator [Gammaproteobacteria bacterium]|nr:helix-turn-helix transcriptional regulator [Gammaproteobacteria bacterium]